MKFLMVVLGGEKATELTMSLPLQNKQINSCTGSTEATCWVLWAGGVGVGRGWGWTVAGSKWAGDWVESHVERVGLPQSLHAIQNINTRTIICLAPLTLSSSIDISS